MLEKINQYSRRIILPFLLLFIIVSISKQLFIFDCLSSILDTLYPILFGIVLALLFHPIVLKLNQKMKYCHAVCIVYIGVAVALFIFLAVFIPSFYRQLESIYINSGTIFEWFEQIFNILPNEIQNMKSTLITQGSSFLFDSLSNIVKQMIAMVIAYITAFFLAIDLPFVIRCIKKLVPNHSHIRNFYLTLNNIFYQYLVGTTIDLIFIVISCGIILKISHFPGAFLYASILALLNLWPYIGATLGFLLIVMVAILSFDQIPYVSLALVWIVQQFEANLLQPFIFQKTMDVRPFLAFVFVFLAQDLFGVIGVLLSPIFAAMAQIAFRSYMHTKTKDNIGEWKDIWYDFDEVMKEEDNKYKKKV